MSVALLCSENHLTPLASNSCLGGSIVYFQHQPCVCGSVFYCLFPTLTTCVAVYSVEMKLFQW